MKISRLLLLGLAVMIGAALAGSEPPTPCSAEWNRFVDQKIISGDGQGHGPDLGSDEWKGVVEFKLGIRDQADLPARDSDDWCQLIDRLVREL
jgi:hypothetical protein